MQLRVYHVDVDGRQRFDHGFVGKMQMRKTGVITCVVSVDFSYGQRVHLREDTSAPWNLFRIVVPRNVSSRVLDC